MPDFQPTPLALDITGVLRPGVYILRHGKNVAYVGRARCILVALTNHIIRNRARMISAAIPVIHFDGLEIIPCDPVRATELQTALIAYYSPTHQRPRVSETANAAGASGGLPPVRRPSATTTNPNRP